MKFTQAFSYIFTVICFYILVCIVEIVIVLPIVNGIELDYFMKTIVALFLLVIINPIITWEIVESLPFKPKDLRASEDYRSDIKKRPKEE